MTYLKKAFDGLNEEVNIAIKKSQEVITETIKTQGDLRLAMVRIRGITIALDKVFHELVKDTKTPKIVINNLDTIYAKAIEEVKFINDEKNKEDHEQEKITE